MVDAGTPPELPPGLREEYLAGMRSQLGLLTTIADRLTAAGNDREALAMLQGETHKIHGSAGSYGFAQASRLAAGLEATAKDWVARPDDPEVDRGSLLHWFVGRLAEMLGITVSRAAAPAPPPAAPPRAPLPRVGSPPRPSRAQPAPPQPAPAPSPGRLPSVGRPPRPGAPSGDRAPAKPSAPVAPPRQRPPAPPKVSPPAPPAPPAPRAPASQAATGRVGGARAGGGGVRAPVDHPTRTPGGRADAREARAGARGAGRSAAPASAGAAHRDSTGAPGSHRGAGARADAGHCSGHRAHERA